MKAWHPPAILLTVLLFSSTSVLAQSSGTGAVVGRIADSSGALLPGVTVTLQIPQALGQYTAVTVADGTYRIPNLPPATYEAKAELQ